MVLKTRLRRIVFLIVGLLVILDCVGWDLVAEAQVANGRQNGGARMLIQAVQLDTKILGPKQVIIDVRSRPSYEMGQRIAKPARAAVLEPLLSN